ncbi:BUD22-domain-containing protein [Polychytrium aggregatum]|uniref:BUD22-domain-containing protein n=1 Tax=Polychytrium aggregatum TaxID=110093 RepID=UPI0022FEA7E4|nr:BUD22-domain-containing protein [Polychytrium aggregatum]KAI9209845.1 BUD22-domain-containing protein [Polychytrium aggregatum]
MAADTALGSASAQSDSGHSDNGDTEQHIPIMEQNDDGEAADGAAQEHIDWDAIREKLSKKIYHLSTELRRCAKKAATLETPKIVKKIRLLKTKIESDANTPEEVQNGRRKELSKLEGQIEGLKKVDVDRLSRLAFTRAIKRLKTHLQEPVTEIAQSSGNSEPASAGPESSAEDPRTAEPTSATDPMQLDAASNRVLNSKLMAQQIQECVSDLCKVIYAKQIAEIEKKEKQKRHEDRELAARQRKEAQRQQKQELNRIKQKSQANKRKASDTAPTSKFITSLAGAASDESDPEDGQSKKNRMGQRARRELAEKKYGRNAKHLIAEKEKRKTEYLLKRPAKPGIAADRPAKRVRVDDGDKRTGTKLHPSWEAKQKQRQAISAYQGKKTVFSGDNDASKHSNDAKRPTEGSRAPQTMQKHDPKATLHPSWQAKLNQRNKMNAGGAAKSTKIVFSD